MAKMILSYVACSCGLMVAIALLCGGELWSLAGVVWCGMLFVGGDVFPTVWRRFWVANMLILRYFDCL